MTTHEPEPLEEKGQCEPTPRVPGVWVYVIGFAFVGLLSLGVYFLLPALLE